MRSGGWGRSNAAAEVDGYDAESTEEKQQRDTDEEAMEDAGRDSAGQRSPSGAGGCRGHA